MSGFVSCSWIRWVIIGSLGVTEDTCPVQTRQLGLIRLNSVYLNYEKKEKRERQERAKEGVVVVSSVPTGTCPHYCSSCRDLKQRLGLLLEACSQV